jgi:hypothetical protein
MADDLLRQPLLLLGAHEPEGPPPYEEAVVLPHAFNHDEWPESVPCEMRGVRRVDPAGTEYWETLRRADGRGDSYIHHRGEAQMDLSVAPLQGPAPYLEYRTYRCIDCGRPHLVLGLRGRS